jgi:glycyl-tRNA synthetase
MSSDSDSKTKSDPTISSDSNEPKSHKAKTTLDASINVEDIFRKKLKSTQMISTSFEFYGGPAGSQVFGVLGTQVREKLLSVWKSVFCNFNFDGCDDKKLTVYEIYTPIVGPESVYIASGHVENFTDSVVKDREGKIERVDHYLKTRILEYAELKSESSQEKDKLNKLANTLDDLKMEELEELMKKYGEPERCFGKIFKQNLMLDTKTNSADTISYLRPETAQGSITEFLNVYRINGEKHPFGIAQIGSVFRKEIRPKPFTRMREFTQAEIEFFHDPLSIYEIPDYMKHYRVNIYSSDDQTSGEEYSVETAERTFGDLINDVDTKKRVNSYIVYFMFKTMIFCELIGLDSNRLRFRQHLKNELAHYSCDCWDVEYLIRDKSTKRDRIHPDEKNWIEIIGIAHRGGYDLSQHSKTHDMSIKRTYDPPIEQICYDIKLDMKKISGKFRKIISKKKSVINSSSDSSSDSGFNSDVDINQIRKYLFDLKDNHDICDYIIEKNKNKESFNLNIYGRDYEFEPELIKINKILKKITHEKFIPHIVEPSFGIDRIMYALLNNIFWIRDDDPDRVVLSFNNKMAPINVVILPLYAKEFMTKYIPHVISHIKKVKPEFVIRVDTSSTSIGKKYSRFDEIGVPYAVTIDHQTDIDGTVTLRTRDDMKHQVDINGIKKMETIKDDTDVLDGLKLPEKPPRIQIEKLFVSSIKID